MQTTAYIQWYNENEGRSYPIDEFTTQDDSSQLLPSNLIVDLSITADPIYTNIYLSYIKVTSNVVSVSIASDTGGLLVAR